MADNDVKQTSDTKSKGLWIFMGVAVAVALLLAIFISPYASSSPDGLERVAEDKGFIETAEEYEPIWKHSPIPDYAVSGVENERVATGLSGLLGVLITVAVAAAVGLAAVGLAKLVGAGKPGPDDKQKPLET